MKPSQVTTAFLLTSFFLVSCLSTVEIQKSTLSLDNRQIPTIIVGDQEWFAENLSVKSFSNGDEIIQAKTLKEWNEAGSMGTPAWCYYNNDPENGKKYGKLYNWYAVADPRGLAPKGWKVPSNEDWEYLIKKIGNKNNAGYRMKSKEGWIAEGNGSNESGFTALPGGGRYNDGTFSSMGSSAFFWSSSDNLMFYGRYWAIYHNKKSIEENSLDKNYGFAVRCLKETPQE